MRARFKGAILGVAAAGILVISGPARAQDAGTDGPPATPSCTDTDMFPNPIFISGSTAFEPVVQAMAVQLNNRAAGRVTLLYAQGSGSCQGVATIKDNSDLPTANVAHYFTTPVGGAGRLNCTVPAGVKADVAISDVFYETCGLGPRPTTLADVSGPVQAMLLIVPASASAAVPLSITAEEAADVWGCGGVRGNVAPWLIENNIQQRNQGSGTQNIIAKAINVLASSFHGTMNAGGGNMVTSVGGASATNADSTIGFLAADAFDTTSPQTMRALAFRGFEQTQAYYASSAADSFDKRNVRDGHYLPWGYEHVIVRVDSTGKATTQAAQNFVDWVLNNPTTTENAPGFDPIQVQSSAHVIPNCAMKVKRQSDGGFLSAYTPADPCNCAFETAALGPQQGCPVCTDDTTCTGGTHCHHGFCE